MFCVSEYEGDVVIRGLALVVPHVEVAGGTAVYGLLAGFDVVEGDCPGEVPVALCVKHRALFVHAHLPVLEDFHHQ